MTRTAAGIPASIVPIRYAVTFGDASLPVSWPGVYGPTRAELASWIADRAVDEYRRTGLNRDAAWQAAKRYAAAELNLAEAYGSTELFAWPTDVSAILEAWQAPTTQGQADALAAFLAAAERHGLTAAELSDGIATAEAEAEAMTAAAATDGTLSPFAATDGPLEAWELDLIAEHTLADLALSDPAGVAVRASRAAKAAKAAELEAELAAAELEAAERAADAVAELEAAKAAAECSHPAELADPAAPRMVCASCGAFRRWTTPAPTAAELEGMRRALDAVAADLNGAILPAELGAPAAELEADAPACNAERVAPGFRCPTHRGAKAAANAVPLAWPNYARTADGQLRQVTGRNGLCVYLASDGLFIPSALEAVAEADAVAELEAKAAAKLAERVALGGAPWTDAELALDEHTPADLTAAAVAAVIAKRYAEADAWTTLAAAKAARSTLAAAYRADPSRPVRDLYLAALADYRAAMADLTAILGA